MGSGDRSERIRTYNFPQGRVTDHRINLTLYKLDQVMDGDLFELTEALSAEHQAEQLAAMGSEASAPTEQRHHSAQRPGESARALSLPNQIRRLALQLPGQRFARAQRHQRASSR